MFKKTFSLKLVNFAILTSLLFCYTPTLQAQKKFDYNFRHFSVNDGLSQYDVSSIIQDHHGYIWIGTYDGLNRYDGYENKIFKHDPEDPFSLSNNRILCLLEDPNNNILIGTSGSGLALYNPRVKKFYTTSLDEPLVISALCIIDKNHVLLGTGDGRLFILNFNLDKELATSINELTLPANHASFNYVSKIVKLNNTFFAGFTGGGLLQIDLNDKLDYEISSIPQTDLGITSLFVDNHSKIWMTYSNGLKAFRLSPSDNQLYEETPTVISEMSPNITYRDICQDIFNNIWISSSRGLYKYNPYTQKLFDYNTLTSLLISDECRTLYIDKSNVLWTGTSDDGCMSVDLLQKQIYNEKILIDGKIQNKVFLKSIFKDNHKQLWIGTKRNGLLVRPQNRNNFKRVIFDPITFPRIVVTSIVQDKIGNLWLGTWSGLYFVRYNQLTSDKIYAQKAILNSTTEPTDILAIYSILIDTNSDLWLATRSGLYRLDVNDDCTIKNSNQYTQEINKLSSNWIMVLKKDFEEKSIWAGTQGGGVMRVEYEKQSQQINIQNFRPENTGHYYLSHKNVWTIFCEKNRVWVGTDEGLNLLQKRNGSYNFAQAITTKNGLSTNKIVNILQDSQQNLWLGTGNGLCHFSPKDSVISIFDHHDGFLSNTFTEAAFKDDQGILYFGGIRGVSYFNPAEIKLNDIPGQTIISKLLIFNQTVKPEEKIENAIILYNDITYTSSINLNYKQSNFSIEFIGFHFAAPLRNQYQYKLEGYDKNWIQTSSITRLATYSNLPSGQYTFLVKSSNNDGLWDATPARLYIDVKAPPWQTWWAYSFYILLLLLIIGAIIWYFKTKMAYAHQLALERHMREQEHKLTEYKLDFFTQISHELRTPLTLIMVPLEEIRNKINDYPKINSLVDLIYLNTKKLLTLLEQLLDFRKKERGDTILQVSYSDLDQFIDTIIETFKPLALGKNIVFEYKSNIKNANTFFDQSKVDIILSNLISNALKNTPEKGLVRIELQRVNIDRLKFNRLIVSDTGNGIEPEKLDKIFDMFYHEGKDVGFGIGLALVKGLVNLHHGSLEVESLVGAGTTFVIDLPASQNAYMNDMIIQPYSDSELVNKLGKEEILLDNIIQPKINSDSNGHPLLLIVEDNHDLRNFISSAFSVKFDVLVAENGQEGYEKAVSFLPDIVLSDVMMPAMDGIALCKKLKNNELTSHIPIILLTAKTSKESEIESFDLGADDYVTKPFNLQTLNARISHLLDARKKLQEKFSKEFRIAPTNIVIDSLDEQFLSRAIEIIEENIEDENFSINLFSQKMGVSRSQLLRKLKGLTSETPMEFIKTIRLQRAAQLLIESQLSVTEICYQVGFNFPSHFTQQFAAKYNKTPKEYRKQSKSDEL